MPVRLLVQLFLLLTITLPSGAREALLPRHPAPSPDCRQIALSWQGDIWVVPAAGGQARRLTVHSAPDRYPIWSRDGRWIAFASSRHGNPDVFIMAADGGSAPRRLTFNSTSDMPMDFSPDGGRILFSSSRTSNNRWMRDLSTVPIAGGTPALTQEVLGNYAAYSPAGDRLAFVRGSSGWTRSNYRGAANYDLWLRQADGTFEQVTDFAGTDCFPTWRDDNTLIFLSDRGGHKNLFSLALDTGLTAQLTDCADSDIRFPRSSADGRLIAWEFEDGIWTLTSSGSTPTRLHIDVPADQHVNRIRHRVESSGARQLTVNPDETLAAYIIHGDIFLTEITSADDQELATPITRRLTSTPARERDLSWSISGDRLLFSSDRNGDGDLFTIEPEDTDLGWLETFDYKTSAIRSEAANEHGGVFSPCGEKIAYMRGKGDLLVCDTDGDDPRVIFEHWDDIEFCWSPDGRWLTFRRNDIHYSENVWIVSSKGGEPYNVSRHPDNDTLPQWSPDGKRLVWISQRHDDTDDVWGVWLTRADHERNVAQWHHYWREEAERPAATPVPSADGEEIEVKSGPDLPEVVIDFEGLWERVRPITDFKGDEYPAQVSPDGKRVLFAADFTGERDLYSVRWDGEELERLTTGNQRPTAVAFSKDGKTIYYLNNGGSIRRMSPTGSAGDPVPFTARFDHDLIADRDAALDQAWRALNEWFYDPEFHGVDWAAQRERYRPWALAASSDDDFREIVRCMLGELNASHMNYYPPRSGGNGDATGDIGAHYDPLAGGPGLLITGVVPGSPAARTDVALEAGDRILAVEDRQIAATTNIHDLLNNTINRRIRIQVRRENGDTERLMMEPVSLRTVQAYGYREWVRERRALVDELSGGRLGYLHIRNMMMPAFEDFESSLYNAGYGKEGLIIDVRSNGGGWTTDYLFTVLGIKRHAFTIPRDYDGEERGYPQSRLPLAAWAKPALTICNEESFSNAEIFAHAFKGLKRGPVVGIPTHGGVISTGSADLVDGGRVRLPLRGWFTADTGVNMELNGCIPDYIVAQPPTEDLSSETDTQLRRSVEIMLSGLADDPFYGNW
ncbi:MAG: PDZ domain-containing protein [bacterium]|nr:PDZ domain-containing protein [bacterium]